MNKEILKQLNKTELINMIVSCDGGINNMLFARYLNNFVYEKIMNLLDEQEKINYCSNIQEYKRIDKEVEKWYKIQRKLTDEE